MGSGTHGGYLRRFEAVPSLSPGRCFSHEELFLLLLLLPDIPR